MFGGEFRVEDLVLTPEAVVELDSVRPKKRRRKPLNEAFVQIPLRFLAAAVTAVGAKQIAVIAAIFYPPRGEGEKIAITAKFLEKLGVEDSRVRTTVLRRLERAGLISVDWSERASPVVTILMSPTAPDIDIGPFAELMAKAIKARPPDRRGSWWRPQELLEGAQKWHPDPIPDWWPKTTKELCDLIRAHGLGRVIRHNGKRWAVLKPRKTQPNQPNQRT
jgi:hypothetical protein